MLTPPPLSLYIHIPWCIRKCPYCDFNSHAQKEPLPEQAYVDALLDDLSRDWHWAQGRQLETIFIGGGTPSLFSPQAIDRLLSGIRQAADVADDAEITMEANPGTFELARFAGFAQAGVNRLSIGVQSFDDAKLTALGRVHQQHEAVAAAKAAAQLGFRSFNLDLMHGLPGQTEQGALQDLQTAINLGAPHISWYQLTLEPNTQFYSRPPTLPDEEILWSIQTAGQALLERAGYQQYEVSAYSLPGFQARHNRNYWRFGDYLGIGCGAHGKITTADGILRTTKVKHPKGYLEPQRAYLDSQTPIDATELPFEFMLNQLRLFEPFSRKDYEQATGLPLAGLQPALSAAQQQGLLRVEGEQLETTVKGRQFLNSLLELFV